MCCACSNNIGDIGIGVDPWSKARLRLTSTPPNTTGETYGIFSAINAKSKSVCGAYFETAAQAGSQTSSIYGVYSHIPTTVSTSFVYGIYSEIEGTLNANNRYAGYFSGGKVVVEGGNVGIGREPSYLLDVNGTIRVSSTLYSSDECLKNDIKPLTGEKDKLYLLQGKSYKKILLPSGLKGDYLAEKREKIEFPEYGYLAQELKEVFPDLVD